MSSSNDSFESQCEFHVQKCCQHLHRTKLSRGFALEQIGANSDALTRLEYEISLAIDSRSGDINSALAKVIEKTHFVLLKIEFELFLIRDRLVQSTLVRGRSSFPNCGLRDRLPRH